MDVFIGYCYVAKHEGDISAIDASKIINEAEKVNAIDRILIAGNVTVTEAADKAFLDKRIKLIGNEGQTIGPIDAPMAVHKILLGSNIVLLEGIILKGIKPGKYLLSAAPLNLSLLDGAPCRACLIKIDKQNNIYTIICRKHSLQKIEGSKIVIVIDETDSHI